MTPKIITNNAIQHSQHTSNVHEEVLTTSQHRQTTQMSEILPRHVPITARPQHQPTQSQRQTIEHVELGEGELPLQPIEPCVDKLHELGVGVHLSLKENPGVFIIHSTLDKQE